MSTNEPVKNSNTVGSGPLRAVIYVAKSSEDKHGSISTQIEDGQELAESEGWQVVGTYKDEAVSAYKRNRGPGLLRAMVECERVAGEHGQAVLIVQHSDRLARGDVKRAKHLVQYAIWALEHDVTIRSCQDPQTFGDLLYAVVTGQRNHEDSARKSSATRDGLKRRKGRGDPVGPLPLGYRVEQKVVDGVAVTSRVSDPATVPVVRSIFESIEKGASPGTVARRLNLAGVKTKRGKTWEARAIRRIAENPVFAGEGGYPRLVTPEQAARTRAALRRMDPAAVQRRKGGRAPQDDSFLLRGIARCGVCDSAMWVRRGGSKRVYVCRHRRQGTRVCNAQPVPAAPAEEHVLAHLTAFVGDAREWALEQVRAHEEERASRKRALDELRREAAELDRKRRAVMDDYSAATAENDPKARYILEALDMLDGEATALARQVAEAEAELGEWQEASEDEALALLRGLLDVVQGRVSHARGAAALHDALASVMAGIWLRYDGGRLKAEFRMADTAKPASEAEKQRIMHLLKHMKPPDPFTDHEGRFEFRSTPPSTFVYVQPVSSQICL